VWLWFEKAAVWTVPRYLESTCEVDHFEEYRCPCDDTEDPDDAQPEPHCSIRNGDFDSTYVSIGASSVNGFLDSNIVPAILMKNRIALISNRTPLMMDTLRYGTASELIYVLHRGQFDGVR